MVRNPNFSSRQYDDSPTIKREKVVQLLCNKKVNNKKIKYRTSKEFFFDIIETMNDESVNLTKPLQFENSDRLTKHCHLNLNLINQWKLIMQHETIGETANLSCAVNVQLEIYLLPIRMVSPAGIAARNAQLPDLVVLGKKIPKYISLFLSLQRRLVFCVKPIRII